MFLPPKNDARREGDCFLLFFLVMLEVLLLLYTPVSVLSGIDGNKIHASCLGNTPEYGTVV